MIIYVNTFITKKKENIKLVDPQNTIKITTMFK